MKNKLNKFTMKKIHLLLLAILITTSASMAQTTLHVTGKVFEKNGDKVVTYIPFASVYYYNYEDSTKLEYFAFTDFSGNYDLGKIIAKKYRIKVVAPGYFTKQKNIGNLPTEIPKEWVGDNITLHFQMEKNTNESIEPVVVSAKTLTKTPKDNFWVLIRNMDGMFVDEKSKTVTTKDGNPVRLFFNGFNIPAENLDKVSALPAEAFKQFEYYDFSKQPQSLYDGVLNVVLITGNVAGKVTFEPKEIKKYDIE